MWINPIRWLRYRRIKQARTRRDNSNRRIVERQEIATSLATIRKVLAEVHEEYIYAPRGEGVRRLVELWKWEELERQATRVARAYGIE